MSGAKRGAQTASQSLGAAGQGGLNDKTRRSEYVGIRAQLTFFRPCQSSTDETVALPKVF